MAHLSASSRTLRGRHDRQSTRATPQAMHAPPTTTRRVVLTAGVVAAMAAPAAAASAAAEVVTEQRNGLQRVKYQKEGWNFWDWEGRRVHYIESGPVDGPAVLLVHGYGASAYHWRYQVPALAEAGYRVFAMDLLGFGWSEKARTDYSNGRLWASQIGDFLTAVGGGAPAVLVGNSLGGYACMAAAALRPELTRGLVLVNSAGPMDAPGQAAAPVALQRPWYQPAVDAVVEGGKRAVLWFAFQRARQPERIREVLQMVYVSDSSLDDDLIDFIVQPATDPQASDVFYLINRGASDGSRVTVNALLSAISAASIPTMLLWGDRDPWMTPQRASQIMALYPAATKVSLQSGHCPHDDTPQEATEALLGWLQQLPAVLRA